MDIDYAKYARALQESNQDDEIRDQVGENQQKVASALLQPLEIEGFKEAYPKFTQYVGKKILNKATEVAGPKVKSIINKVRDVSNDYENGGIQNVINRHAYDLRDNVRNTIRNRLSTPEESSDAIELDDMANIEPTLTNALELPDVPEEISPSESLMSRLIASGQSRLPQLSMEEMDALPDFSGLSTQMDSLAPMREAMGRQNLASQQDMDSIAQQTNTSNITDSGLSIEQDLGDSIANATTRASGEASELADVASNVSGDASKTLANIALDTAPELDETPVGAVVSGLIGIASLFSSVFGHDGAGEINASTQFGTGL